MKIALAQLNYHIGNFDNNQVKITDAIHKAKKLGADLIVFAELAVSGYPPRDFLEFDDFVNRCKQSIDIIARECIGISAIVGAPSKNPEVKGKNLFNSAYFLSEGQIASVHHKTLLPNYDIFDEYRYFEPNTHFKTIEFKGRRLAITICEDLWNIGDDLLYRGNPMDELYQQNPDIIINIAASPFHYEQAKLRKAKLIQNVEKYQLPLFYVNHVGAQTELLFDGGSLAINAKGIVVDELDYFKEDLRLYDTDEISSKTKKAIPNPSKIELIHDALVMGLKNYFHKLGFSKAILGLSGGIDSAVTLVLAERALGNKNVKAILLPSRFSSQHSIDDARELAENLNISFDIISIEKPFGSFEEVLKPSFEGLPFGLAEENLQARTRGVILMALSNKFWIYPFKYFQQK
ncbi:MAG: NAD(+) synthase [Bacteroidales bacterium]